MGEADLGTRVPGKAFCNSQSLQKSLDLFFHPLPKWCNSRGKITVWGSLSPTAGRTWRLWSFCAWRREKTHLQGWMGLGAKLLLILQITESLRLQKPFKTIESNCFPSIAKPTPNSVPKCHIHRSSEHFQGWWLLYCLGNLCQCLTTLSMQKFFLTFSNLNLPWHFPFKH